MISPQQICAKFSRSRFLAVSLMLLISLMTACSDAPVRDELTDKEYYQKAQKAMESNNFQLASEYLRDLESHYPFGRYAEQAQLELIFAQFMLSDLEGALVSSERFIRLHPLHEQVDYAYYMRGMAAYELGFGFYERRFPTQQSLRDQTALKDSFNYFALLLLRFPDSSYAVDAQQRMVFLRERIAMNEIAIARYNIKRHAFLAAAKRAENVMLQYQGSDQIEHALAIQIEAYRLLELETQANDALALLKLNFPKNSQLDKQGNFQMSGLDKEDRSTLFGVLSFGLVD